MKPALFWLFLLGNTLLFAQQKFIYVSDAGNFNLPPWQILKFDENGNNGEVFISDHLDWPQDIFFNESNNTVLISNWNNGRISKFNATTGAYIGEFATALGGPTRMKVGPEGLLYVLQAYGTARVRRYHVNGGLVGDFTTFGVPNSVGIDWDTSGNMYISSYSQKYVRKFSPTGEDLGNFVDTNLLGPTNIWFADNGDLMVIDFIAGSVKRFDSEGNYLGVFINGLPQGEGVEFLPDGKLLLGCGGTSSVRLYNKFGQLISSPVPSGTLNLLTPNAVVLRELPASFTSEVETGRTIVTPSVGSFFQISVPQLTQDAFTLEIYNSTGSLVAEPDFFWDAQNEPNGIYLLLARLANGTVLTQKILVQH